MAEDTSSIKERVLSERRQILRALEKERCTRAIMMIHRREPWLRAGESITVEDSEHILMDIRETPPDRPIDFILHTPGGLVLAAEMIAMAVKYHPAPVTVMVPFYAMSGGTLIALAADKILMEKFSVLGPVDPQVAGYPSASLIALLERKSMEALSDETIILSDIARMAVDGAKGFVQWLLKNRMASKKAAKVADFLAGGYMTHDTPVTLEVAKKLGLKVSEGVPQKVYDLFATCCHGACTRPSLAPCIPAAEKDVIPLGKNQRNK
ncbi:MAG: ATP-dependent Clp protease proteolytic subunit [candidate division Zixibacteria bacterium]|nr:ATP-dependent Clp protease proteolytic subunit [candidate division Zixibacteria bacterium]MCI0596008.1 ATP-dependent Clp protease proteolytic subunit [candidate division Zixibacteria bacterium]